MSTLKSKYPTRKFMFQLRVWPAMVASNDSTRTENSITLLWKHTSTYITHVSYILKSFINSNKNYNNISQNILARNGGEWYASIAVSFLIYFITICIVVFYFVLFYLNRPFKAIQNIPNCHFVYVIIITYKIF